MWKEAGLRQEKMEEAEGLATPVGDRVEWAVGALKNDQEDRQRDAGPQVGREGRLELVNTSSPLFFQTKGCEPSWG